MTDALSIVGTVLLALGLGLATVGLYGLLRKPDIFHQLHAAGLVTGPGVILVLLASVATGRPEIISSAVLVIAFVLVTSSLSTHAIARAALRRTRPEAPSAGSVRATIGGTVSPRPEASGHAAAAAAISSDGPSASPMRILIAHDGSGAADLALGLAAGLAWPPGTTIRLVGVLEADLPSIQERRAEAPASRGLDDILQASARNLERPGVRIEQKVLRGSPARAIAAEAVAFGADLIITGTRGRSRLTSLLIGSVAGEVVDRAPCPVLVARSTTLRHVLLASDGSGVSTAASEIVARWPIFRATRITVLSVGADPAPAVRPTSGGPRDGEERRDARGVAAAAASGLTANGMDAVAEVVAGDPAAAIVDFAQRQSVDLIVLGSRGHSGWKRTVLGSVARAVLSAAGTSVLIVRLPLDPPLPDQEIER